MKTEKQLREEYIRASDARVSKWSQPKRQAFYEAVYRITGNRIKPEALKTEDYRK